MPSDESIIELDVECFSVYVDLPTPATPISI